MGAEHYEPTAEGLLRLLERLRAPNGCPWDRAQTRETLGRSLAGETAELLDAIDRGDASAICDELGDVLMNALFQIVLAREKGEFTAEDVFGGVIAKMIRRHAHFRRREGGDAGGGHRGLAEGQGGGTGRFRRSGVDSG